MMATNYERVSELNRMAGKGLATDWEALRTQALLVREETEELLTAVSEGNVVDYADAALDVLVTAYGCLFLLGANADVGMHRLMKVLKSRFDDNEKDATETKLHYATQGIPTYGRVTFVAGRHYIATVVSEDTTVAGKHYPAGKWLKSVYALSDKEEMEDFLHSSVKERFSVPSA